MRIPGIKATIIYPATEQHIKKFEKTLFYTIEETNDVYENITLPHILKRQLGLQVRNWVIATCCISCAVLFNVFVFFQWVYNILERKSETERVVYENTHPSDGFVLLPDLKWDGKQVETLYLLAICNDRSIKSIRDLNQKHLPLLNNILNEGSVSISLLNHKHLNQLTHDEISSLESHRRKIQHQKIETANLSTLSSVILPSPRTFYFC